MSETRPSLAEPTDNGAFVQRHIGPNSEEQAEMLAELGYDCMASFIERVVPAAIRCDRPLELDDGLSEDRALAELRSMADKNECFRSLIGQGYYGTITPNVIVRNLLENPAWYTAYTPYQPEISQGRLEALINFQTMIADLTGLEIANASMLDEATAAAEAMTLCQRTAKTNSNRFFVDRDCLPQTIDVIRGRAQPLGIELVVGDAQTELGNLEVFGILLQYPGVSGEIRDYGDVIHQAHDKNALVAMAADLLGLVQLKSPGELGADIAVGSCQRLGLPMGFGGPHAAYMATREAYKRSLPGRLVGLSIDSNGRPAYRLALQTREQHIRREKATSNICTAQVLLAVMAGMYAVYHGPDGLRRISGRVHRLTAILAEGLARMGFERSNRHFFDTLTINTGDKTAAIHRAARDRRYNLRQIDDSRLGMSLDETVTTGDVETLWEIFGAFSPKVGLSIEAIEKNLVESIPADLKRIGDLLGHPVFRSHHSETGMMRYLRKLADRDIALDRTMIPLGSCTMKLNATAEMQPISWPEFAGIHPFAPLDQVQGYLEMIRQLEQMLCACTGYAVVSLQPNAGSQGEFAGLLAIRAYHQSRGEGQRKVCLIPGSAHGTNPASARMCGMDVVVVKCDDRGNVDIDDLTGKAEQFSDELAAIMITYPSTHGVFEESVGQVCDIVHRNGGQVYIDGANLNAMVGLCQPGKFGGDVSHINLHKTFCIPHGGGGPGVGPVAAREHLAPFLPGHFTLATALDRPSAAPVSAAAWGSAGILPISWMYIKMMGRDGLRQATACAILNANYIAHRLQNHYPVLYTGAHGHVAHECIIDLRPLKESSGISVDDVAKRLIDYGFHAPTMSFPVAGTLMIEPTESEPKCELDRFCDAMAQIRAEIAAIERGEMDARDNPLVNAPHTAEALLADNWTRSYSRELAAYPLPSLRNDKYWAPVGRIDNVYGDRHLICSCPEIEDYR